ncbi:hypothetical protein Kpol_1050p3 [Vanderwaltozyma polyspora DSM 70294]|uniref:Uncharacterized protein n=1 Tax=Vanderwaltozyma polyspora (strain ATCC 22028 / DSM 70294 / BCRC 21397 / CBS 2163 / NBRC 10782 / NRRL Y-8283 / UCD 57-17) TaxID=436907 RepID=A7TEQ0_VANPO|nr:uncharacterized protein Kpol_1050p3 [Vanderwaltozyma polyspora DSM 70294]EDO19146.1 hypothetical protein Kpol_1050p3 [Vanderwaltozyma polyspora DSM 70294]
MEIEILIQSTSKVIFIIAILYQYRYNRLHRSIYGLSYDMYILSLINCFLSIWCTLNYKFSPLIRQQLGNRYPLFYSIDDNSDIPISLALLILDITTLFISLFVLRQLIMYRSSKHVHQGISKFCISVILLFAIFNVFTYTCACYNLPISSGRFGVFYLEHINYMWVEGNLLGSFILLPQISLNWMGQSTTGLSSKFVVLSFISILTNLLGSNLAPQNLLFYERAFNFKPNFVQIIQFLSIIIILSQAQYFYRGLKPHLPKGKSFL